jgi:hypothetical protein
MALLITASSGPLVAGTEARPPTISDIATCNQQAQAKAGNPSASPGPRRTPDTPAEAPRRAPRPGTQTDPSGSIVIRPSDPLLEGMATEGVDNPDYRSAYRDCMAGRLRSDR